MRKVRSRMIIDLDVGDEGEKDVKDSMYGST